MNSKPKLDNRQQDGQVIGWRHWKIKVEAVAWARQFSKLSGERLTVIDGQARHRVQ